MPTLKKYKDGNSYYIRTGYRGNAVTLQITPEGVDYLHKHNYVSSDGDFDNKYLQHLRQKKWAFTKGLSPLRARLEIIID